MVCFLLQSLSTLPSASPAMPHSLVSSDTRNFSSSSHWIPSPMSVKSSAFAIGISAATDPSLSPRSEGAIPNRRASATSSSNSSADYVSYSRPANARLTGRVDKRKRRRPIRCLPSANARTSATSATTTTTAAASIDAESAAFCTLKLPYLDDYQRNPTAYSRALMGTERAQATHSSAIIAATDSTYATHNSHSSPLAAFRTSNGKRIHSTASLSSSSSSTSSPLPIPEFKQHESEPHMTRKSAISSIIHRLFPSLDKDALAALAAAAAAERSANPRLKKRSQLPSNNTAPSGKSDSAHATGEPGSDDNRVFANTASTGSTGGQTPTTINNGNDPMYVGDKLGQEIFRLHPHSNSCPIRWTKGKQCVTLHLLVEKERLKKENFLSVYLSPIFFVCIANVEAEIYATVYNNNILSSPHFMSVFLSVLALLCTCCAVNP
ncbi:hypothetical protein BX070DRAFT_56033 [Coemansia spiralis]|nr:hypothetical protein BX070DRAFT_56033 [Coemansia spiralis]